MKTNFSKAIKTYDENSLEQFKIGCNLLKWLRKNLSQKEFENKKKITVLDIGCGTGKLTKKILNEFINKNFLCSITAIDKSPAMISYAEERNFSKEINFISKDIENKLILEIEKKRSYDFFFSNAVLHWLDDLDFFFDNLKKISHAKSRFFFSIYTDGTFKELNSFLKKANINYYLTIPYLSYKKIIEIVKKNYYLKNQKIYCYKKEYINFKNFQKKQHLLGSFKSGDSKKKFTEMKKAILYLKKKLDKPFTLTHEVLSLEITNF